MCDDFFAVNSDISFGDAWLNEFQVDKTGTSIGIARTETGSDILARCKVDNEIFFDMIDKEKVKESQAEHIIFKNVLLEERKNMLMKINGNSRNSISLKYFNKLMMLNAYLSHKKFFRFFLLILTGWMEKFYFKMLNKTKSILLTSIKKKQCFNSKNG